MTKPLTQAQALKAVTAANAKAERLDEQARAAFAERDAAIVAARKTDLRAGEIAEAGPRPSIVSRALRAAGLTGLDKPGPRPGNGRGGRRRTTVEGK